MTPRVSVVIPSRNNGKTIYDAIFSIQHQTIENIEIIVVDDNSDDNTAEIVQHMAVSDNRIRYFKLYPGHPSFNSKKYIGKDNVDAGYSALQFGWQQTRADWVTRQDGDDVSFLNRLEIQLDLTHDFNVGHLTTSCIWFQEKYKNKKLDFSSFSREFRYKDSVMTSQDIYSLAKGARGVLADLPDSIFSSIPFFVKRRKYIHRLFYRDLVSYPGAANSPMMKREYVLKAPARKLNTRRWPSLRGRGSDRDQNFNIAYSFKDSLFVDVPLYAWRTPTAFSDPYGIERYLID